MPTRGSVGEFWHKLKEQGVFFTAVVPAVIAALVSLVGIWFSYSNSQRTLDQARQLTEYRNDIDLLARFADFHFASRESRRDTSSLYVVDQMKDPGYRKGLRVLVFRDVMARNFRKPAPVTRFDKDDDDWRITGDALSNLRKAWQDQHERRTFGDWWCEEKRGALKRWPDHEERLRELYRHLDDQHLAVRSREELGVAGARRSRAPTIPVRTRAPGKPTPQDPLKGLKVGFRWSAERLGSGARNQTETLPATAGPGGDALQPSRPPGAAFTGAGKVSAFGPGGRSPVAGPPRGRIAGWAPDAALSP